MRCYRPHLSLVKLIKAGTILPPPFFGPNIKKVLDLFETNNFCPDYEESSRSVWDKSFPIKNIPGLKTRNNKDVMKQNGPIGEIYFEVKIQQPTIALGFATVTRWKNLSSKFIFLKISYWFHWLNRFDSLLVSFWLIDQLLIDWLKV